MRAIPEVRKSMRTPARVALLSVLAASVLAVAFFAGASMHTPAADAEPPAQHPRLAGRWM